MNESLSGFLLVSTFVLAVLDGEEPEEMAKKLRSWADELNFCHKGSVWKDAERVAWLRRLADALDGGPK